MQAKLAAKTCGRGRVPGGFHPAGGGRRTQGMIIALAIVAAVVAIAAVVYTIRIAPKRTERLPGHHQPTEGQGEELTPSDRAA